MLYLLYERTLVSKRPHHGKIPEWLQTRGKLLGKESIWKNSIQAIYIDIISNRHHKFVKHVLTDYNK
jgi:hypothetical protein